MERQPQNPELRNNPENFQSNDMSKKLPLNAHADVVRGSRDIYFGMSHQTHP